MSLANTAANGNHIHLCSHGQEKDRLHSGVVLWYYILLILLFIILNSFSSLYLSFQLLSGVVAVSHVSNVSDISFCCSLNKPSIIIHSSITSILFFYCCFSNITVLHSRTLELLDSLEPTNSLSLLLFQWPLHHLQLTWLMWMSKLVHTFVLWLLLIHLGSLFWLITTMMSGLKFTIRRVNKGWQFCLNRKKNDHRRHSNSDGSVLHQNLKRYISITPYGMPF